MKTLRAILCLVLCLSSAIAFSQKNSDRTKPALFTAFPEKIQLSRNILENTIQASAGEQVVIAFSNEFHFKGIVISNLKKYDNLQSVMIRSASFDNAIFQLSKVINEDKTVSYKGRIINPAAADGYEIKEDTEKNYSFNKFETAKILQECNY